MITHNACFYGDIEKNYPSIITKVYQAMALILISESVVYEDDLVFYVLFNII